MNYEVNVMNECEIVPGRMLPHGNVYHFTNTVHLPWIFASGELRPGRNKLGRAPVECIWATGSSVGDLTCSAMCRRHVGFNIANPAYEAFRQGEQLLVRFTLKAADFFPWKIIRQKFVEWTEAEIERYENAAREWKQPTDEWYCRAAPLPLDQVVAIDTRSYRNKQWKPLHTRTSALLPDLPGEPLGVEIDGNLYVSLQGDGPGGVAVYACMKVPPQKYESFEVTA
jgi:hypothetical protein